MPQHPALTDAPRPPSDTPTHRNDANLMLLAEYLDSGNLQARFSMRQFAEAGRGGKDGRNCGSVGCVLGHGPYAGIPKDYESWPEYGARAFLSPQQPTGWWIWDFLFSAEWSDVRGQDTPEAAAARIRAVVASDGHPTEDILRTLRTLRGWGAAQVRRGSVYRVIYEGDA